MDSTHDRDIVLTTLNARYSHASLSLRYLFANLKDLQPRAEILEFTIRQAQDDISAIADALLSRNPKIIGFGLYIWNARATTELLKLLKARRAEIIIVLGGPEVSYETETHPAFPFCN